MSIGDPFLKLRLGEADQMLLLPPHTMLRIGRSDDSSLVLADELSASREHALIRRDGAGLCVLLDLGSRNGTMLNGRRLTVPATLRDGDRIEIGRQEIIYNDPLGAAQAGANLSKPGTQLFLATSLITVMVIDICGYTPLSRALGPEGITALMSELFEGVGAMLDTRGCWSQKFIGDAIMGVWLHKDGHVANKDLIGVIDVLGKCRTLCAQLTEQHDLASPLRFGVALNTGAAQTGNIGSASSQDFTALGDTVNMAFRLQAETRRTGYDIHIGRATFDLMEPPPSRDILPPLIDVALRGYETSQPCYALQLTELGRLGEVVAKAGDTAG